MLCRMEIKKHRKRWSRGEGSQQAPSASYSTKCFLLTQSLFFFICNLSLVHRFIISSLCSRLRFSWPSMQEALAQVQTERDELKEKIEKVHSAAQAERIKMAAEIEDLIHTKTTLEERLIELIRQAKNDSFILSFFLSFFYVLFI